MLVVESEFKQELRKLFRGTRPLVIGFMSLVVTSHALAAEFTEPKQVSLPLLGIQNLSGFEFLGDSNRAIYDAIDISSGYRKLYNAKLDKPTASADNLTGSRHLRLLEASPDGEFIVFGTANNIATSTSNLFSQKSDMSEGPVALSPQLGGGREIASIKVSPDGQTVVFRSEEAVNNLRELYSVPITGPSTERVKLSGPMDPPSGSSVVGVNIVAISPDSTRVLYMAKQTGDAKPELYSVAMDGSSAPVRLTELGTDRTVRSGSIHISPDSSVVTFISNQEVASYDELYRVPITGPSSAAVKLNHASDGESVLDSLISPDGNTVVYRAARSDFNGLYSVPIDRSNEPVLISPTPVVGGGVKDRYKISVDSSHVVFLGDLDTLYKPELYSVPIAGPSSATVKLHTDLSTNQNVGYDFELTPDNNGVVFLMDTSLANNQFDLYHSPLDGSAGAAMLNTKPHDGVSVNSNFYISPNGEFVVYVADQDTDNISEMYMASLTEPQAPVKLNAPFPAGGEMGGIILSSDGLVRIGPNSLRILYGAEQLTKGQAELFLLEMVSDDELCLVIKTAAGKVATFCL
jgi:Tol biopolymer transport system component